MPGHDPDTGAYQHGKDIAFDLQFQTFKKMKKFNDTQRHFFTTANCGNPTCFSGRRKHIFFSAATTIILLLSLMTAPSAKSQDMQTLFDGDVKHGGFGGPVVRFGSIDNDLAVWVGGRGGWIINFSNQHSISLGGGGYGLVTEHQMPFQPENGETELAAAGYGGFEVEYTNQTYRLLHFTTSTLIGAGGLTTRTTDHEFSDSDPEPFFVLEPGVHAEVNMTHFFRIAAGLSYRITSGIDKGGFGDSDFSGLNAAITFKFGSF